MKKIFLLIAVMCLGKLLSAQYVYTIKADSVKITNNCDTAELIIENHTQNIPGFLFNKGKGRTEFKRAEKLNDSTLVIGTDTFLIRGSGVLSASNGLNMTENNVKLGGDVTDFATILRLAPEAQFFRFHSANESNYFGLFQQDNNLYSVSGIFSVEPYHSAFEMSGSTFAVSFQHGLDDITPTQFGVSHEIAYLLNARFGIGINKPSDMLHVVGTTRITDTLKLPNLATKTDTTAYKPLVTDGTGNVFKMAAWSPPLRKSATVTGSSYTVPSNIDVVFVNYAAGQSTITLPTGTLDREITIKNLHTTNNVIISGLDTAESNTVTTRGAITVKYTGSAWVGINKY